MSQPKFAAGEIVILQSKDFPHLNGEYAISHVIMPGTEYKDPTFGQLIRCEESIGYYLEGDSLVRPDNYGNSARALWRETALRKRHTPGEYSFDGLKQVLSMPIDRRDFA